MFQVTPEFKAKYLSGNGIWFARKSTDAQDFEHQLNDLSKFCTDNRIIIPKEYQFNETRKREDLELSDTWKDIVENIVKGRRANFMLIDKYDRLTDFDLQFNHYAYTFVRNGVHIISVAEGVLTDIADPMSGIKRWQKGQESRAENVGKSWRVLSKRQTKSKLGDFQGISPLGFDMGYFNADLSKLVYRIHWLDCTYKDRSNSVKYDPDGNELERFSQENKKPKETKFRPRLIRSIDPQEIETVEMIFDMFVNQNIPMHRLAKHLNRMGNRIRGKLFNHKNLTLILSNPAYMGTFADGRRTKAKYYDRSEGKMTEKPPKVSDKKHDFKQVAKEHWIAEIENNHDVIIAKEVWADAQEKLSHKQEQAPRNENYWLKGILTCGNCGGRMTPAQRGGKPCYVCATHRKAIEHGLPSPCGTNSVHHVVIEKRILEEVQKLGVEFANVKDVKQAAELKIKLTEKQSELDRLFVQSANDYVVNEIAELRKLDIDDDTMNEAIAMLLGQWSEIKSNTGSKDQYHWTKIYELDAESISFYQNLQEYYTTEHKRLTVLWSKATAKMQEHLLADVEAVERQLEALKGKVQSLDEKAKVLLDETDYLAAQLRNIEAILQEGNLRIKSEAVKGLFKEVKLNFKTHLAAQPNRTRHELISVQFSINQIGNTGSRSRFPCGA